MTGRALTNQGLKASSMIKTDVETHGDLIRFLIKEVEGAAFTDIEDVVPFVKWLDDELSYLVDERAVLKHFVWPEQKADTLREADTSFRDDPKQHFGPALKKMQSLFEKLELGVYNLSRMRESSTRRYKAYQIPSNWMLDTGFVSQKGKTKGTQKVMHTWLIIEQFIRRLFSVEEVEALVEAVEKLGTGRERLIADLDSLFNELLDVDDIAIKLGFSVTFGICAHYVLFSALLLCFLRSKIRGEIHHRVGVGKRSLFKLGQRCLQQHEGHFSWFVNYGTDW